ncbi:cation transporter [Patescibacteria group bacterium]
MISGSIAVLSSAIDSLLDLFVSVFNYFAVSNAEKKADSQFNYGRGKIEALASLIE